MLELELELELTMDMVLSLGMTPSLVATTVPEVMHEVVMLGECRCCVGCILHWMHAKNMYARAMGPQPKHHDQQGCPRWTCIS